MLHCASGKALVTFHDVAACFSEDGWKLLGEWQKELYKNVIKEIHHFLISLGCTIVNPDTLLRIQEGGKVRFPDQRLSVDIYNPSTLPSHPAVHPDLLLRIKQEDESCCRDQHGSEETDISKSPGTGPPTEACLVPFRIKDEEGPCPMDHQPSERSNCSTHPSLPSYPAVHPDLLLRIKQEDESCCKDEHGSEERDISKILGTGPPAEACLVPFRIKEEEEPCPMDHQPFERRDCSTHPSRDPVVPAVFLLNPKQEERMDLLEEQESEERTGDPVVTSVLSLIIKQEEEIHLPEEFQPEGHTTAAEGMLSRHREDGDSAAYPPGTPLDASLWTVQAKALLGLPNPNQPHSSCREISASDGCEHERTLFDEEPEGAPEEMMSSRYQKYMEEERAVFSWQQKNENTIKKTKSDLKLLKEYMEEIKEIRTVQQIPHEELDVILSQFIISVRKKNGTEFEPHSLRGILGSIDRHLKSENYPHSIFLGNSPLFKLTRESLSAKQKYLKKQGKGAGSNKAQSPTDAEIDQLYESGTLSLDSPAGLLNMLFFNIAMEFALRTKEHYDLMWGDLSLCKDAEGHEFLEYNGRPTKIRTGENPIDIRSVKPRMYANLYHESRDPIAAYKKYTINRPVPMRAADAPFYLVPNLNYNPQISLWFRSMKIGLHKLRSMMREMSLQADLSINKPITNHSTRKTAIQNLPPTEIQQVFGHKSVQSINNYSILAEENQRMITAILASSSVQIRQETFPQETTIYHNAGNTPTATNILQPTATPSTASYGTLFGSSCLFNAPVFVHISNEKHDDNTTANKQCRIVSDTNGDSD